MVVGMRLRAICLTPIATCLAVFVASCASAPTASRAAAAVPTITWEQKLGWMVRLEDQRILRDPNPPAPIVLRPATQREPALIAPGPPSDLIKLLILEGAEEIGRFGEAGDRKSVV